MLLNKIGEKLSELVSRRGFVGRIASAAAAVGAAILLRSPVALATFPVSCCNLCRQNNHQACQGCACTWSWTCTSLGQLVTCTECFSKGPCIFACNSSIYCSSACYTGTTEDCWPS
jgi:hypothetical protein